jgi:acyl-CoA synthetase (AMP-forming)/AMP-acid ligase II
MSRAALQLRVLAFIDSSLVGPPSEPFEALALDIHRYQLAHDPVRKALSAGPVTSWQDIPAIPVDLFKDLPIGTVRPEQAAITFRTSGTTGGSRGCHYLHDTRLYDHGARLWHQRCVPDAPTRVVALLHDPSQVPDSSLSHMVADFGTVTWTLGDAGLDVPATVAAFGDEPVYVAATAFALAELLQSQPPSLPPGSVVMVTGGFKGRNVSVSDEELYERCRSLLQPARLITEYGMTELSSQLWGTPGQPFSAPPWLRAYVVDPATGAQRPAGSPGQLRFVDLCNLDSAVTIETLDQGTVGPDGSVLLEGRLEGSEARGCSLTVEELWERLA